MLALQTSIQASRRANSFTENIEVIASRNGSLN